MDPMLAKQPEYPTEKARESKLPLDEQDKALNELHEYINILTDVLRPVLTPDAGEIKGEADNEPTPPKSPLANRIKSSNQDIYLATNKIRTIIGRVEC